MFEMEGAKREKSPVQHSGASSDVTSSLFKQDLPVGDLVKRLETENKVLQGRIRGYKTLGDLLQESKEENKKLSDENRKLKSRLNASKQPDNNDSVPPDYHSMQETAISKSEATLNSGTTTVPFCEDEDKLGDDRHPSKGRQGNIASSLTMTARSIGNDHDNVDPTGEETHSSIREVTPMQESIVDTQNDLSRMQTETATTPTVNMKANLEFDSDVYEEPEYGKSGKLFKPPSSMSIISSGPDEKYHFPSLSSATFRQRPDVRPKTAIGATGVLGQLDSEMSLQLRNMQMQSGPGNSTDLDLASQFRKMSDDISKMEDDVKKYKSLSFTFAQENQKLKTAQAMEKSQMKNQISELREENKLLISRIKDLQHNHDHLAQESLTSQTKLMDWVNVERPVLGAAKESLPEDLDSLVANIRELRKQNKELKVANQSWNKRWQELTKQWEVKVDGMKAQVNKYKEEIEEMKVKEKKLQEECEKMVQNSKAHAHEEEMAKEDAMTKLHQTVSLNRVLQDENCELKTHMEGLTRDKHNMEAELSVLKSRYLERPYTETYEGRSVEDLKTEVEVLRQQLTVFEEDFARERQDRATAQSARDELQTKVEQAVYDKNNMSQKIGFLEQRVKNGESSISQILQKNEQLQTKVRHSENQRRDLQQHLLNVQNQVQQNFSQRQYPPAQPYQNIGMFQQQGMQAYSPQPQLTGGAYVPSPQRSVLDQPYNQVPYMQYGMTQPVAPIQTSQQIATSDNWMCSKCTFSNIPSRTVCEMCGLVKRPGSQTAFASRTTSMSEPVLMSRDVIHPPPISTGRTVPDEQEDLIVD